MLERRNGGILKMIYYLHKETGFLIKKDDLKQRIRNRERYLEFNCLNVKPFDYDMTKQPYTQKPERYVYFLKDIPFSEDFDEITEPFEEEELIYIYQNLRSGFRARKDDIILEKIENMLVKIQDKKIKCRDL